MALTDTQITKLINLGELNYFRTKLNTETDKKYVQPTNITAAAGSTTGTVGVTFEGTGTGADTKTLTFAGSGGAFSVENSTITFAVDAAAEYSIAELSTASTGAFKTYQLYKGSDAVTGSIIDIPKDFLVKSATSDVVVAADKAAGGKFENDSNYEVGDAYLDFVINSLADDETDSHIYVNVKNLVDTYTAGNGIDITSNVVSAVVDSNNANGLSVGANGIALATVTASSGGTGGSNGAMTAAQAEKLAGLQNITTIGNGLDLTSGTLTAVAGNGISVGASGIAVQAADTTISVTASGISVVVATDTDIDAIFA